MRRLFRSKLAWGIALAAAAVLGAFGYHQVNADTVQDCTNNSIIYCGSQTSGDFINKVKANNPADLQAIYQNFGLAPADYNKFVTSAKMGTAYKDGRIVVDGQTVATNAWSIGRNNNPANHSWNYAINGHMYYASSNTSVFIHDSIPVMVMFDAKGAMQFAVLTACGNPITGNKVSPTYSCDLLQKQAVQGKENTYSFTTNASAANGASVAKVVYDFGDGQTAESTSLTSPVQHTYTKAGNYTAKVTVYVNLPGNQQTTVTGAQCQTQITIQAPPQVAYTCDSLQALPSKESELDYTFQANTSSQNATLTGADFDFGDGMTSQNVTPESGKTNVVSVDHTYTKAGNYTIKAAVHFQVTGDNGEKTVKTVNCEAQINTKVCSTNANLPPNSPECQPCKYNSELPANSTKCVKPAATVLPNTGAGDMIGLFAGASLIGFVAYRFYLSRRFLRG